MIYSGASFIHGIEDNPVAELAVLDGRSLVERVSCSLFDSDGSPVDPCTDESVEHFFNQVLEACSNDNTQESLESGVNRALRKTKKTLTERELRVFWWHLCNLEYSVYEDLSKGNKLTWDQDDVVGRDGAHCVVENGGLGRISDALAETVDVRLRTQATSITYGKHGVKIECVENSRNNQRVTLEAKTVLCTLPLGVLKARSVEFVPRLPPAKMKAIDALGFGVLNKISLLFKNNFWTNERRNRHDLDFFGNCDDERGELPIFIDLSPCSLDMPILCVLVAGDKARELEREPLRRVVRKTMKVLGRIFGDVVEEPLEVQCTSWGADEFARGSYSYVGTDATPGDYDALAEPVEWKRDEEVDAPRANDARARRGGLVSGRSMRRVYFAGEATNRYFPASLHGAFASGLRESRRIVSDFGVLAEYSTAYDSSVRFDHTFFDDDVQISEEEYDTYVLPRRTFEFEAKTRLGKVFLAPGSTSESFSNLVVSPLVRKHDDGKKDTTTNSKRRRRRRGRRDETRRDSKRARSGR